MNQDFKKLEEYFKKAKSNHIAFEGYCHSCKELTTVTVDLEKDGKLIIEGGAIYFPEFDENEQDDFYIKCNLCYKEDPTLRNFRKIEVFSRVVGFLTPTNRYNPGKIQEFKMRRNYKLPEKEMLKVA